MKKLLFLILIIFGWIMLLSKPDLLAESSSKNFLNQFFTEQTITVTKEGDGFLSGTFRTILMQAIGIRQNNPFTLVTINFDPSVKKIRFSKGNLPLIEKGLITIDCADKVTLDGSQIDPASLDAGESLRGLYFQSSGNILKNCRFIGFKGSAVILAGNRNQIRENIFGELSKNLNPNSGNSNESSSNETSISILEKSSENIIESNEFINNKKEGIAFSLEVGGGNRIIGNSFMNHPRKAIQTHSNNYQTAKLNLRPIVKEGDSYLISGTLTDPTEIEIFMLHLTPNKESKLTTIAPPISLGKGDFSLSIKNKGFFPGITQILALATSAGRNTSEFSDPVTIPVEIPVKEVVRSERQEKTEEKKTIISNTPKPINEGSDSAFSVGSVPPPEEILPPDPPSSPTKSGESTINLSKIPKRSGGSDEVKTDSPFEPTNAP